MQSELSESSQNLEQPCQCVAFVWVVQLQWMLQSLYFCVTWVFVADGELTGTGRSAAFDVRVVIEMRGLVLGEGVLCEMCICLAGGGVGGVGGERVRGLGNLGLVILGGTSASLMYVGVWGEVGGW